MKENPFFERNKDFDTDYSDILPHWHQWGKMQYITFRLADSLPQNKIAELQQLRSDFLTRNPLPWSEETKQYFRSIITPAENKLLDNGYGSCIFSEIKARMVMENILKKFHMVMYEIVSYIIMPNHIHLLIIMRDDNSPEMVMRKIWQHSTYHINRTIGSNGTLWQKTYYDHLVRNKESLKHIIKYIYNNSKNLPQTKYSYYRNEQLVDSFGNWLR